MNDEEIKELARKFGLKKFGSTLDSDIKDFALALIELVKPKWTSVKDDTPAHDQQVWINFHFGDEEYQGQGYAIWDDEEKDWFLDLESKDLLSRKRAIEMGLDTCTVTHWMPMPDKPEKSL